MRKILFAIVILTSFLLAADPLAEMIWMRGMGSDFLYFYAGTSVGVEYIKALEIPIFPSDIPLHFSGCDVNLLKAIIRDESNFRVHATSLTGALGVGQIVRSTAKWLGIRNPYNPVSSTFAICKYVKYLSGKFKTMEELLWAYHDGEGAVRKRGPSSEARNYAKTVLNFYENYKKSREWTWFKDRILLKASALYLPPLSYQLKLGMSFSIFGSLDVDGGCSFSNLGSSVFLKSYFRLFHDLALIVDVEPDGTYFGTSFWNIDRGIEVLIRPGYGKARLQVENFGMNLSGGRISIFYRMGF